MRYVHASVIALITFAAMGPSQAGAQGVSLSGGMDVRAQAGNALEDGLVLQGLFLNARKVFSDELGDRWIVVAQADADDNLARVRPYQLYGQYKGPLGKWNLRAGHFLLPFGLLADFDTERLVLRGVEEENLGLRLDTGVEALGYAGDWDWVFSVSNGLGRRWLDEWDGQYAVIGRVARAGEEVRVGVSAFAGEVLREDRAVSVREEKVALDLTRESGRWTWRTEVSGGWEEGDVVATGLGLASYALTGWAEVDAKYSLVSRFGPEHLVGIGTSLRVGRGWFVRPVALVSAKGGERSDGFVLQLYYDFTKTL